MRLYIRLSTIALLATIFFAAPSSATLTFTQLDDDVFVVSHRVKLIGSRGKAMKMVYTKAASLCVAAGFTHYQIVDEQSEAAQEYETANASVRVRFFQADAANRIGCEKNADPEYVAEARTKLAKQGYDGPPDPDEAAASAQSGAAGSCPGGCTVEQIAAMARTGLSDEQIVAACNGG